MKRYHERDRVVLPIGTVITTRITVPGWTVIQRIERNHGVELAYVLRSNTHVDQEHKVTHRELMEGIKAGVVYITIPGTMPAFVGMGGVCAS